MYKVERCDIDVLKELELTGHVHTVFLTSSWVSFLAKNQHAEPVLLVLLEEDNVCGYFVGLIIKKAGLKILGSPFEGWLTPDMGFVRIKELDTNEAVQAVKRYAFSKLGCVYIQIIDKKICADDRLPKTKKTVSKLLYINNNLPLDKILENFSKNGRRDVRASTRKGVVFEKVPFDINFVKRYYAQLEDVFAKQNLKPFYSIEKMYDLVESFRDKPENVLALEAKLDGVSIATVISFGCGEWAYYLGAASYRKYQKYLPNEGLFWEFVKHWNEQGIKYIDLVGEREYKMKYNPVIVECPVICLERIPGILCAKNFVKWIVTKIRIMRGYLEKKKKG